MCIKTRCHTTSFIQVLKKEFLRRKTTEILDLLSTVRLCQAKYHKSAQQILQKMFFKKLTEAWKCLCITCLAGSHFQFQLIFNEGYLSV